MGRMIDADRWASDEYLEKRYGSDFYWEFRKRVDKQPTVEAIPKNQYEARLKADMVAVLTEIQLEIEESENCGKAFHLGLQMASNIIQQKINALKGEQVQ